MLSNFKALIDSNDHILSNFSNTSAYIYNYFEDISWVGFYFLNNNKLVLGPFCGMPACCTLELTKGVCAAAYNSNSTICVDDVHEFEGHIACDSRTNSELVIPIRNNGKVIAVLDIDSMILNRFKKDDIKLFEEICTHLEKNIDLNKLSEKMYG